jgi:two-component system OmpR family sensor kinase
MTVSLRARLLAASLALVALGLLAADVATYSALRSFLYGRVDAQLEGARVSVERALFQRGIFAQAALSQLGTVVPGVFVQVRDARGATLVTVLGRPHDAPEESPDLPDRPLPTRRTLTLPAAQEGGPSYRTRISTLDGLGGGDGVLIVALPLTETKATLNRLVVIEVLVTAGVLVAAAAAGLWLVRLGLRPLEDIEGTAAQITAGDMSRRVSNDDDRTEVGRVGKALNVMLDRIDVAFDERRASEEQARASEKRMRRFVADASHELRTPVAAVRAYAELYRLGADERPEDLARLLSRIEHEAERMGVLVDDLLLLTRLDEGRPLERVTVDLGAIASEAVAAARAVDPERPIELGVVGSVEVTGDPGRLRQVVDNLLANVRSHTPPRTPARVVVSADGETGEAVLEVADRGPGVDPDDAPHVFERFYRADPSRARAQNVERDVNGAGLGLAIVAAIAEAHGGRAEMANRDGGGAVVRVRVPLAR